MSLSLSHEPKPKPNLGEQRETLDSVPVDVVEDDHVLYMYMHMHMHMRPGGRS